MFIIAIININVKINNLLFDIKYIWKITEVLFLADIANFGQLAQ